MNDDSTIAPDTSSAAVASSEPELGFDGLLDNLETIVVALERGELSLELALERFESGMALARRAATVLDNAEARVEVLMRDRGQLVAQPLDDPNNEAG